MKNTWLFLKLGLVSALLVSSLACGSAQSKNGENSSDVAIDNVNSGAANNAASETKANKRDPQRFCRIMSDFVNGEYKQAGASYSCSGRKSLKLASGRSQDLLFDAVGDAENVKTVRLAVILKTQFKDNAEVEDKFLESCERLWFETFTAVLPQEIRKTILSDKGRASEKIKNFTNTTTASFIRHRTDAERYGLSFDFELPDK